ncbi:MAG: proline racemase family protein [Phycisphaerales bacterium]|nr:proline racemase family protein [Phycisphaerales bacterium]
MARRFWKTIDGHTAGEPLRIIVDGVPAMLGETMLERRAHAMQHFDELRRVLMWEPRGHRDMYGAILTPPATTDGDVGVLFLHNEGFSTMCGHGIIALAMLGPPEGLIPLDPSDPVIRFDTPAGRVTARVQFDGDGIDRVSFRNVPSFVAESGGQVEVPGLGEVRFDLAFGGAFYAYVDAAELDVPLVPGATDRIVEVAMAIKHSVMASREIKHAPQASDLDFLYGVILVGPAHGEAHSRNVCVFADGEVDRSPTGTGVSGRAAIHHARGDLATGEVITIESILGTTFDVSVAEVDRIGQREVIIPEVTGRASLTGRHEFIVEDDDPLGGGFLLH